MAYPRARAIKPPYHAWVGGGSRFLSGWRVLKEMVGRRLSQEEAKRLLAKVDLRAWPSLFPGISHQFIPRKTVAPCNFHPVLSRASCRLLFPHWMMMPVGKRLSRTWIDTGNVSGSDPPPLKWSDLRYVFDIQEDCNGKEAIQA